MSLIFYYAPHSSAVTVHWALEELKIPYEKVRLDIHEAKDQNKPAFRSLNPNGKVPLLVHEGTPIFESVAIMIHLGETYGVARKLFPGPGPERARALSWLVWTNVTVGAALQRYNFACSPRFPAEQHNAKAAEAAKREIEDLLGILDRALEGRTWLVGSDFSLVDAHAIGWAEYLEICGLDPKAHKNVAAWMGRGVARPAHDLAFAV